jgi:hypothetical protein
MSSRHLIIFFIFLSTIAYSQKKGRYIVLDVPETIITRKPLQLCVKDTVNKDRSIYQVPDELGGLKPGYPMAKTYEQLNGAEYEFANCLLQFRTLSGHCENLLVRKDDSIIVVDSKEIFIRLFAPVEDKEEALSFAFAIGGVTFVRAIYDFSFLDEAGTDYEIFRKELIPTSVKEVPNGYEVILFSTYWGSTSHCSEVVLFVSTAGDVKVLRYTELFHDKNDNIIID